MPLPPDVPTLATLDLFVSVVRSGSMSAAASRHGISQPSASARVRQLERQLGVELLVRFPNGSAPTAAGGLVAEWAEQVVAAADHLVVSAAALRSTTTSLKVAASLTIAEHVLPARLGRVRAADPEARVELDVVNTADVVALVRAGTVALGFIEGPADTDGLGTQVVGGDELVVVVDPNHPWSRRRRPLDPATLAATALVAREHGSGTREVLEVELRRRDLELVAPALELSSSAAVRAAVEAGTAPAVLSRLAVVDAVASGRLAVVPTDLDLRRDLRAVWQGARPSDPVARRLLGWA